MEAKPQKHLINILKSTKDHHPNFTLFLGAGSSITSGIKSAGQMIDEWRGSYCDMHSEDKLKQQTWYNKTNEYSELFESLYDQPTQRREYIENCIVQSVPSWGYVYLVNMLQNKTFNTIFTTNFDDLINEACYTFSNNLRPVVCAHDSSIKNIRLTSNRPKIIKLHGDFLFDNIKNTIRELESLEDNMRSKFRQYANEFGMIVMGYAGNDRSIMDTLNTLLHSDSCFPHGIYWCVRKGTKLAPELENLARFPRFHLIEIIGFDEFMAELHESLGYQLQEEVADPYAALARKLDKYSYELDDANDDESNLSAPIRRDMNALANHVKRIHSTKMFISDFQEKLAKFQLELDSEEATVALQNMLKETKFALDGNDFHLYTTPNILLANAAFRAGEYNDALKFGHKALKNNITIEALVIVIRSAICVQNKDEIKLVISKLSKFDSFKEKEITRLITAVVDMIDSQFFDEAHSLLELLEKRIFNEKNKSFVLLNKGLIYKLRDGEIPETCIKEMLQQLDRCVIEADSWLSFGFALLTGKEDVALEVARSLPEELLQSILHIDMPIFTLISPQLYEKVQAIAKEKGFEVPEFVDEDADHEVETVNFLVSPEDLPLEGAKVDEDKKVIRKSRQSRAKKTMHPDIDVKKDAVNDGEEDLDHVPGD